MFNKPRTQETCLGDSINVEVVTLSVLYHCPMPDEMTSFIFEIRLIKIKGKWRAITSLAAHDAALNIFVVYIKGGSRGPEGQWRPNGNTFYSKK